MGALLRRQSTAESTRATERGGAPPRVRYVLRRGREDAFLAACGG